MVTRLVSNLVVSAAISLSLAPISVWAQQRGIEDDYNVQKYQAIYDASVQRLRDAQALLARLEARLQQAENQVRHEAAQLDQIQREVDLNTAAINNANARISQLEQSIRTARAESAQLNREIADLQRTLSEEERRNADLANQATPATREAERLEATAREKTQQAEALTRNATEKLHAFQALQSEYGRSRNNLDGLERAQADQNNRLAALRTSEAKTVKDLENAKGAAATIERDVVQKKRIAEDAENAAVLAESEAEAAEKAGDPSAAGKRRKAMAMRLKAQQAKQDYETAARSLDAANAQVARIEGDLARIRAQIAQMEEALSNLNLQIAAARAALAPLKDRLDAAKRDYEQAQSLAQGAENDARQAQTQASAARTRANQLQAQFETSQRRLAELRQGVADRQNRFTALQRAIENWVSEQETERRNLVAADQRNRQLVPALNQQRRALADAQRELNESERDRDQALRVVANEDALVRGNLARLEEVRRNLADGIAAASNTGRDDGFSDGAQEGERVARINANTQGRDIGEREGRVSGTREGIENARRRGQTEGSELGQNEGRQTGDREGRSRGQEEGRTNGKAAGLQEGYQLGRDEGYRETYPRGEADGHKQGGYDKGKREGYAQGKSRGETDGRAKGDADGKREGHDRFLNAELQNVTLPNRAPSMSATFDHPQWDNYNPRRRYTQHPAMQDAYNETYRQSFFSAAADRYDAVFPGLYEQIRRDAFEATRQDYANRSYPAEQKEAFDRAYSESFENARRIADRAGYDAVYPTAYDQARIAALPIRRDEGLRDGRTAGYEEGKRNAYNADFARGRSDGERMGYDETFNNTYLATKKAAYDEVVAYYTNNAVLKYDGVVLKDANDDGIYAPGEPVTVAVAIKNFGLASQRDDVVVQAQNPTRGLIIERGSEVLVGLPGQARAVVTGVTQLRVAPTVEVGTPQSVDVNVLSAGKTIGKARLDLKTGYPYLIANINKPDHPTPNSPNQVSVDVRNTSSKQSNTDVTVRLVSLDNLAETTTETINLGALASGETRSAQLGFQFREENANKTLQFEVQIFEGDWLLGKQRFTTDTAKRWNFTPTAAGLIVVDTAKRANRAELVAKALSLGYDTWDVRVEGPLANQALKYVDKSIILLSVNASYNKVTANALGNYLSRGGQLLVGVGSGTDRTDVGQMIKRMEAMVSSTATFGGLSLFASNDFKPTEPKFLIAEMRDTSNEDGVNTLAARVAEFNVVRKSLDEKVATYLAAVASGDAESVALSKQAIERDLIKEMLDNRAAKTNSYKKNKAALKLTAYINILVTKQDVERKALAMVYPELEKTRKKIEKSGWFKSEPIKGVMGPLKRAYNRDVLGRRGD